MPHACSLPAALTTLALNLAVASSQPRSVERWKPWELELSVNVPAGSNPFTDVSFAGHFVLDDAQGSTPFELADAAGSSGEQAHETSRNGFETAEALPRPLLAFGVGSGNRAGQSVPNLGSSAMQYPDARLIGVAPSFERPPGAQGESFDFGTDAGELHAVLIPSQNRSFMALAGTPTFTITGWLQPQSVEQGDGGNRIFNWCSGGPGVDLVWNRDASLTLSVNEWPDNSPAKSSPGMVRAGGGSGLSAAWTFFAARYSDGEVAFFFGSSTKAAAVDKTIRYKNASVGHVDIPAALGNFAEYGRHSNGFDRLFRGRIFEPRVFKEALTSEQIIEAQNRSGCSGNCSGRTCGSDGCGGSCGSCFGKQVCAKADTKESNWGTECTAPTNLTVRGFYDGDGKYVLRFSPPYQGQWKYSTISNNAQLNGKSGILTATPAVAMNHGPVKSKGYELLYADGTPHFSTGTTCYQWASMQRRMQQQTLRTLNASGAGKAFNKIRMTVFPKWYQYNHQNPVEVGTAFEVKPGSAAANSTIWNCVGSHCPSTAGSFDFERFNVSFWQNYESLIRQLDHIDVVADIIVFHPYDSGHWGFDCMGGQDPETYDTKHDELYLQYLAARLSHFKNVWWAMANEWSFCRCKSFGSSEIPPRSPVWDRLFKTLAANDPYGRQMSIHNGNVLYNHSQPWISHVSLQGHEDDTPTLRLKYRKPVIWDEVQYEGNITSGWGALSGVEEADRFWWGSALGVSVGHSETVLDWEIAADSDKQPLWWAKGGTLRGLSPERIQWFRAQYTHESDVAASGSTRPLLPPVGSSSPSTLANGNSEFAQVLTSNDGKQMLLHFVRPGQWNIPLPTGPPMSPSPQLCSALTATNCMGGDIRNAGAVDSKEACCGLCADLAGCRAWSWNQGYKPQSCWLKSSCDGKINDTNVISGISPNRTSTLVPRDKATEYEYEVWWLDFWGMKAELLDATQGGTMVIVDVPDVPYNVQIFAKERTGIKR